MPQARSEMSPMAKGQGPVSSPRSAGVSQAAQPPPRERAMARLALPYHNIPGHVLFGWVINANQKAFLEHGMHPGVYVSPSLLPLFSLTVPYGMRRTNSTINHRGAARSIWETFASPVTEISLLLSKVTLKKKTKKPKKTHPTLLQIAEAKYWQSAFLWSSWLCGMFGE